MLDLKYVRDHIDTVQENLNRRHTTGDLDSFVKFYDERRAIIQEVEQLKAVRNAVTAEISQLKRNKESADDKIAEMQRVGDEIGALDAKLREVEA